MLPLTSTSTITRTGCGELSKTVNGWGLPLSLTSKSARVRSVTSRSSRSVTVTKTGTVSPPPRNTGS